MKILQEGNTDNFEILSGTEMDFILGGAVDCKVSVSVFTYCHKKLIKRGGLPSFVSLLWKVANGLAIGFYNSPMVHWVAIGQSCQGCR